MINFIIDLFKRSSKGDNFRISDAPYKYMDSVTQLNGSNSTATTKSRATTPIGKTKPTLSQSTSKGSTLPR